MAQGPKHSRDSLLLWRREDFLLILFLKNAFAVAQTGNSSCKWTAEIENIAAAAAANKGESAFKDMCNILRSLLPPGALITPAAALTLL